MSTPRMMVSPVGVCVAHALITGEEWTPEFLADWVQNGFIFGAPPGTEAPTSLPAPQLEANEFFRILLHLSQGQYPYELPHEQLHPGLSIEIRYVKVHRLILTGRALDLTAFQLPIPIDLSQCTLEQGIILNNAHLGSLNLSYASLPILSGDSVRIDGDLFLRGLKNAKAIHLRGARVSGSLLISESTVNPTGEQLPNNLVPVNCDGAHIGHGAVLRDMTARGKVRFVAASIGTTLDFSGSQLSNPTGVAAGPKSARAPDRVALNCDSASIGGDVFLRAGEPERPFTAEGEVRFNHAKIGGQLACTGGKIRNQGRALSCDSVRVESSVFLNEGFHVEGQVNFNGAVIGGNLDCTRGAIENGAEPALVCEQAIVSGSILMCGGFGAEGGVSLCSTEVGGDVRCHRGLFFVGRHSGDPRLRAALDLSSARIAGTLYLCNMDRPLGRLDLRDLRVKGFADDMSGWPHRGFLRLDGFVFDTFSDDGFVGRVEDATPTPTDYKSRKQWLELQPDEDLKGKRLKPQPWTQCASVLQRAGHGREASQLLDYRDGLIIRNLGGRLERIFYAVLWPFAGYGHKTHRAFFWAVAIVLLGWVVFARAYADGYVQPVDRGQTRQSFVPLIYSLDTFLPVIDLGQEAGWVIKEESLSNRSIVVCKSTSTRLGAITEGICQNLVAPVASATLGLWHWFRSYGYSLFYWLEIIMGWALLGIWSAGLAGVFRHKAD